jgi:hypothetical protein
VNDIKHALLGAVPPLPEPADRLGEVRARVRRTRLRTGTAAVGTAAVVSAIALLVPQVTGSPSTRPAAPAEIVYQGNVLVMQTPEHGPRLCAQGAQADIFPQPPYPSCAGPAYEVVDWEWDAVTAESADGVTWGTYYVEGTWDGQRFTLTEPPGPADPEVAGRDDDVDSDTSPCPEPAGGWRPVDVSKATDAAFEELNVWAPTVPEYAGMWLDQSYLEELDNPTEEAWNDPTRFVLNLRFVGDPADWEPRVREIWGGALCVSSAEYSLTELNDIQTRLHADHPEIVSSSQNYVVNAVRVEVLIATPELQADFDEQYGPGAVDLQGWLEPAG